MTKPIEPDWQRLYRDPLDAAVASKAWAKVTAELARVNPQALAKTHAMRRLADATVIYDRGARVVGDDVKGLHNGAPTTNRAWSSMRSGAALCAGIEVELGLAELRRLPTHREADGYVMPRWLDRQSPRGAKQDLRAPIAATGAAPPSVPRPETEGGASCP